MYVYFNNYTQREGVRWSEFDSRNPTLWEMAEAMEEGSSH